MAVPGQNHIHQRFARQGKAGIFRAVAVDAGADAGMGQGNHQIGPRLFQFGQPGAGRLDDIAAAGAIVQVFVIPDHHLRRQKADNADADRARLARAVCQHPVQQHVGAQQGLVAARI